MLSWQRQQRGGWNGSQQVQTALWRGLAQICYMDKKTFTLMLLQAEERLNTKEMIS